MRALPVVALVVFLLLFLPYVVPLARRALTPGGTTWRDAVTTAPRVLATVVDITPWLLRRESAHGILVRRSEAAYVTIARHSERISGRLQSVARAAVPVDDASIVDIASFRARRDARMRRATRIAAMAPRSGITVAHRERIVSSDTMEHLA